MIKLWSVTWLLRLERGTTNSPHAFTYVAHAHVDSTEIFPVHWSPQIQPLLLCGYGLSHLIWMCDSNFVWSFILCFHSLFGPRQKGTYSFAGHKLWGQSYSTASWKPPVPLVESGVSCVWSQVWTSTREHKAEYHSSIHEHYNSKCAQAPLQLWGTCVQGPWKVPSESHNWTWESPLFHYTHKRRRNEWIKLL